jgi:hypothetical protein
LIVVASVHGVIEHALRNTKLLSLRKILTGHASFYFPAPVIRGIAAINHAVVFLTGDVMVSSGEIGDLSPAGLEIDAR